jgi:2-polyprenyl-3-methyl-5-hydroxy-6-metoxy-1,4-benzoquinol methylase
MNRVEYIRAEEKKYHNSFYENYKLFEQGSWLHKPVKTVMDLMDGFKDIQYLRVLDLGCGIGRNSIPIAEKLRSRNGIVVCVDLLESAIEKLNYYSKEYEVQDCIESQISDIEHFNIAPMEYDFIVAVSALEHVSSERALVSKINEMALGTKIEGINCIIINSNVREITIETNKVLDPMFEVNITTQSILELLDQQYNGWEIQQRIIKQLDFDIERDGQLVRLTTDCITYVAKKI